MQQACLLFLCAALAVNACACHSASGKHPTDAAGVAGAPGTSGICGNGRVEPGETCEGSNLNGSSCTSLGFQSGTLGCAPSCQFDTSACTGALPVTVNPSRTSCTAPCGVFFDATGTQGLNNGDYVGASFSWNFDVNNVDPTAVHKQTVGFVTAHVFDNPGAYQVSVRVRDLAGHAGSTTVPITVSAPTGPTIYVASSGNDKNTGASMAQPMATLAAALAHPAAQSSVLLRRGDTFKIGTSTINLSVKGPFLVGAYTDPASSSTAAPILSTANTGNIVIISGGQDIQLADLHIVTTGGSAQGINVGTSPHTLIERVEIEGIGNTTAMGALTFGIGAQSNPVFFVDCHAHDFIGYGLYGDRPNRFAMIGTTIEKFTGGEHGVRIQGGNTATPGFATDTYVAENTINVTSTANSATQDAFTFRGDDQNIVFVGNRVNRSVGFQPQNESVLEHVSDALVEDNVMNDARPDNGYVALNLTAQHVVVRNNLFVNTDAIANVVGYSMLPANFVDQIVFDNNTAYVSPAAGVDNTYPVYLIQHRNTTGSLTVENNILWSGMTSPSSTFLSTDQKATSVEVEDHNLIYEPNAKGSLSNPGTGTGDVVGDPKFVSTDLSTSTAFQLSAGSAAIDVGAAIPTYQDFLMMPRPVGSAWDIGAFEYTPGSSTGPSDAGGTTTAQQESQTRAGEKISTRRLASR